MKRRRRRGRINNWRRLALALAAFPGLYLLAAIIGGMIPINRGWTEPDQGITIYIADNGLHADLLLPVREEGLDWAPLVPRSDFAAPPPSARWIAFGAGERRVYLDTPTWSDITPRTAWAGIAGGERVMHVEYVADPTYSARELRVTPEQYRRLWAAVRASFALDTRGRPVRIDHPGYGPRDAFYEGVGRASAIQTCNQWLASRLRLAGIKAPLWSPFVEGLVWRYRRADHST
ncbi:MAG: TIGR02117 family protein [Sphingomonas bacterium]|nr:TIGR02117 family protein [Sphingomonas bacterium]